MEKPNIKYPCKWPYKIIGSDKDALKKEIIAKLVDMRFELVEGNQSKQGKYVSFDVEVFVANEAERVNVFNILKDIPIVKIVI
ncbi:MAG: DUF493 domain-containing protein [PVC group bacterium]|nr:DUF493 domain-containing protein [PVC group bacterium]